MNDTKLPLPSRPVDPISRREIPSLPVTAQRAPKKRGDAIRELSDHEQERAEACRLCIGCPVIIECGDAATARRGEMARVGRPRPSEVPASLQWVLSPRAPSSSSARVSASVAARPRREMVTIAVMTGHIRDAWSGLPRPGSCARRRRCRCGARWLRVARPEKVCICSPLYPHDPQNQRTPSHLAGVAGLAGLIYGPSQDE
jgi:hypothetical protein